VLYEMLREKAERQSRQARRSRKEIILRAEPQKEQSS
jgi:hypothetical protein